MCIIASVSTTEFRTTSNTNALALLATGQLTVQLQKQIKQTLQTANDECPYLAKVPQRVLLFLADQFFGCMPTPEGSVFRHLPSHGGHDIIVVWINVLAWLWHLSDSFKSLTIKFGSCHMWHVKKESQQNIKSIMQFTLDNWIVYWRSKKEITQEGFTNDACHLACSIRWCNKSRGDD